MVAILRVNILHIDTHVCRKHLSNKENDQAGFEWGIGKVNASCIHGFALSGSHRHQLLLAKLFAKAQRNYHTLEAASAQADITTPIESNATEMTCIWEYFFPRSHPAPMVVTLPKLRRMICTGTDILNAKAQLFSILTAKNIAALKAHLRNGTGVSLRRNRPLRSNWEGQAKMHVKTNWKRVMRRPLSGSCLKILN